MKASEFLHTRFKRLPRKDKKNLKKIGVYHEMVFMKRKMDELNEMFAPYMDDLKEMFEDGLSLRDVLVRTEIK